MVVATYVWQCHRYLKGRGDLAGDLGLLQVLAELPRGEIHVLVSSSESFIFLSTFVLLYFSFKSVKIVLTTILNEERARILAWRTESMSTREIARTCPQTRFPTNLPEAPPTLLDANDIANDEDQPHGAAATPI